MIDATIVYICSDVCGGVFCEGQVSLWRTTIPDGTAMGIRGREWGLAEMNERRFAERIREMVYAVLSPQGRA